MNPEKSDICLYKCDNEGRTCKPNEKNHRFIILSSKDYNSKSGDYLSAVALTSKSSENCLLITNEDIQENTFEERTYILYDKVTRVLKKDFKDSHDRWGKVRREFYKKVSEKINEFLLFG